MSAVNQSPLNNGHEIIVVNDGSTDRTPTIVTGIQEQLPRDFVRVISTDNRGPAAAANTTSHQGCYTFTHLGLYVIIVIA